MPPFAVEVHPLAADEVESAERWYRERNATKLRQRAFDGSSIEPWRSSLSDLKLRLLTSAIPDAFCCAGFPSSSSIACPAGLSKSSLLHTLGGDHFIGFSAEMGLWPSPRQPPLGTGAP
jgi:hypothetical protein